MKESELPRHPLFDPASLYSRMRQSARPEYKMRGYFHWQKARAIRLRLPPPVRADGRPGVTGALDVRPVCPLRRAPGPREDWRGSLVLAREADGTRAVGLQLEPPPDAYRTPGGRTAPCRAFLIEPEVLARLEELAQKAFAVGPDQALAHAFAAEAVAGNPDVARLLAAIPDLDGEVRHDGIRFRRLPLADEFDAFPPRPGPLTVVLVFDEPPEE